MAKQDDLRKLMGSNVAESMGAGRERSAADDAGPGRPERLKGATRRRDVMEIEVDRIVRDPAQPREEFDEEGLARLGASLRARGQLQPVRVRWDHRQGVHILIAGERRWRAAKLVGLTTITAVVHEGEMTESETRVVQLIENLMREDLKPIEQAKAFRALMAEEGWSVTRLAEEVGVAQSSVSRALKLLDLPEGVQDKVGQGALSPDAAYEVSRLDDPEEQATVASQIVAGKYRRDEVRAMVQRKKGGRGGKAATRRVEFQEGEFVFKVEGPVDDLEEMQAAWARGFGGLNRKRAG
jgi:ParB family chromosome partitioning protein